MNSKLKAFKHVRAPDRRLILDELDAAKVKHIKEREDMGEEGQRP